MTLPAPIGGFIGLEAQACGAAVDADFGTGRTLRFWNARSALAHLLATLGVRRVWLPAYICGAAAEGAAAGAGEVRYYGVGGTLRPDAMALEGSLEPGDALLGVDYFGAPAMDLLELVARRPDVVWIQDRAQGLWPDPAPWGTYVLYSPRKVLGAPDGGVLLCRGAHLPAPAWVADPDVAERLEPLRRRGADLQGRDNDAWFPAYQAAEAAMAPEPRPMSEPARRIVAAVDTAELARRRRRNAAALLARVGEAALFAPERLLAGAPLGAPVVTPDAAVTVRRMAAQRIFCARHWAGLPSPAADFPAEHALSARLITLPCDHRYDEADMARVADAFLAAL
jgi:hypothetical protein